MLTPPSCPVSWRSTGLHPASGIWRTLMSLSCRPGHWPLPQSRPCCAAAMAHAPNSEQPTAASSPASGKRPLSKQSHVYWLFWE
uniref:Alternative protein DNAJC16 n=1 Tax=Homo sapiens TaxID=9606 RepID=L8E870_HUMAN|nr:alternative protein DNAJC16 [Homo sapiens]